MDPRITCFIGAVLIALPTESADYARAGVLKKGAAWEVAVSFETNVNLNSTIQMQNYAVPGGTVSGLRLFPRERAIVLTVDGPGLGSEFGLTMTNIWDTAGEPLAPLSLPCKTTTLEWTNVGETELGISPDAMRIGENDFNLVSAGMQLWDRYDEATFVYEEISGDFDKMVRVEYQDDSSLAARAGLMARETLDAGKARPIDPFNPDEAFSRYVEVHATPAMTAYGEPAENTHQVNVRFYLGGIDHPQFIGTENPPLENNAPPSYPDAWLRLKRTGQTFEAFRSVDGTNWLRLAALRFGTDGIPPFGPTAFVGPSFSPENGAIPFQTGERMQAFLARFRDYGNSGPQEPPLLLSIRKDGEQVEVSWVGEAVLQQNNSVRATGWGDLLQAVSPHRFHPSEATYFRLRSKD